MPNPAYHRHMSSDEMIAHVFMGLDLRCLSDQQSQNKANPSNCTFNRHPSRISIIHRLSNDEWHVIERRNGSSA